jgi:hypothetical protein
MQDPCSCCRQEDQGYEGRIGQWEWEEAWSGVVWGRRVASFRGTAVSNNTSAPVAPVVVPTPEKKPEKKGLRPMSITPSATTASVGKGRVVSSSTAHE